MEKITDDDLKAMLTKESPKEITNAETGEVQWTEITKEEAKEAFNNLIDTVLDDNNTFEEPLQEQLEQEIDFNTIPENVENTYENLPLDPVLEKRHELSVGLTPENIQALYEYVGGKIEKPDFIDRFMSDADGRLREMSTIMAMMQLSRIPTITAYINQVQERLFDPKNLYDMDAKTLSSTLTNLNKDIINILEASTKTVQTNSQFGSLNNEYRAILDGIMMLPADKLNEIKILLTVNKE